MRTSIALGVFLVSVVALAEGGGGGGQGTRGGFGGCAAPWPPLQIPGWKPCTPGIFERENLPRFINFHEEAREDNGTIFRVDSAIDRDGRDHWIVRRSRDDGKTFEIVDDFAQEKAGRFGPQDIAVMADGSLLVSGYNGGNIYIRRSYDHGDTWTTPPESSDAP